jgi:hypothetical protein
MLNMLLFG